MPNNETLSKKATMIHLGYDPLHYEMDDEGVVTCRLDGEEVDNLGPVIEETMEAARNLDPLDLQTYLLVNSIISTAFRARTYE